MTRSVPVLATFGMEVALLEINPRDPFLFLPFFCVSFLFENACYPIGDHRNKVFTLEIFLPEPVSRDFRKSSQFVVPIRRYSVGS